MEARGRFLASLSDGEAEWLAFAWEIWARPEQLPPPGDWRHWLIRTGRGWGKTRTGAEWVRREIKDAPYVNLIGATGNDVKDIMIEGESGILAVCPNSERPRYLHNAARLDWPNGAKSLLFTADAPERLRGKQHQRLWGDELGAWRYQEAFDQAMFGLRLPGKSVRALWTTTPRPVAAFRTLQAHPNCVVQTGTSYENRANLDPAWYSEIITKYEGTRLGRQELAGELLDDVPGALWNRAMLDGLQVDGPPGGLLRIVVAIDPAATSGEDADETGIITAGVGVCGCRGEPELHGFVMADDSGHYSPAGWAGRAIMRYESMQADRIVAEINNGGEMVGYTLKTTSARPVSYKAVTASRGKRTRAEPIASLYEQGKVHHVRSAGLEMLEDQQCTFLPDMADSPDRVDALVWALTDLMLGPQGGTWGDEPDHDQPRDNRKPPEDDAWGGDVPITGRLPQ